MNALVLVHAAATWGMVGVIWTIQLLVYPAMANVPRDSFVRYEHFHQRRVVAVLAVFAGAEVACAGAIAVVDVGVSTWTWLAGGALLATIWVSTGVFYAPLHGRLGEGFDSVLHRRLVRTNWVRTIAWTLRGLLALAAVSQAATN